MVQLAEIAEVRSGVPESRLKSTSVENSSYHYLYSQSDLNDDLAGLARIDNDSDVVKVNEKAILLDTGDLVFSLISGKAAVINPFHMGYVITQNFIKVIPTKAVDAKYIAFLINEDNEIRHQLTVGKQSSSIMKFSVNQFVSLEFPSLTSLEKQRLIGDIYFKQLKLAALKKHHADLETKMILGKLKENVNHE